MLTIRNYVRPQTPEEAYELCQKKTNVILGGMLWLKMQNRTVNTAIDLCDLGFDKIEETPDSYRIGAMVSLRTLETHPGLNEMTGGAFREALRRIVGVQFRNLATAGGSIYGRFGFSDVLTLFDVLDAKVRLHHAGILTLQEFKSFPASGRDLLEEIIIPKRPMSVVYLSQRNTATDFPVLTCAISYMDGRYLCSIGARPAMAFTLTDEEGILKDGITEESAAAFGRFAAGHTRFGSNLRAGAKYREKICSVLVRRALLAMKEV